MPPVVSPGRRDPIDVPRADYDNDYVDDDNRGRQLCGSHGSAGLKLRFPENTLYPIF